MTDPTGTYQFTGACPERSRRNNMGRLTGTSTQYAFLTSRAFTTSHSYDAASNRTGFTDPEGGSSSYAYDTLNRLQTLTPPTAYGTGSFGFGYDAVSRRTSLTRPNTVNTAYSYDNLSRLLSVTHAKGSTTLDGATYTLDNAGNRTAKSDLYANVTTNYGYDVIYELLSATQGTTTTESYTYDAVGNRLSNLSGSGWSYNTSNELTSRPSYTYTYDYNGNTQTMVNSSGTTTYAWDYDNRLTSVTLPGSGGSASYRYDPFGRRIYKSSSSGTSIYAYDTDNLVEETNATGGVVARYSQGLNIDEPLVMLRSGTASYYEADGLWSVTSLSNTAGALAQTYAFDSFGKLTASSGSLINPFQYTGREFDTEVNLQFSRSRFYDPNVGRFLSEDREGFSAGPNFYSYALNNPLIYRDPFGLDVIVCLFPKGAHGFGHTGYGFPGDPFTVGFYPAATGAANPRRIHGPGELRPDVGDGPRICKLIHTTPDQDACMLQQRIERLRNPGTYDLFTRQCTGFVRDSLKACGIPAGPSKDPRPNDWFPTLPGQVIPNLPPDGPLPRSAQ